MKFITIQIIRFYQRYISVLFPPRCRFYPSCSQYVIEAVQARGFFKGLFLGTIRILKCHPLHPGGHDPVLKKK